MHAYGMAGPVGGAPPCTLAFLRAATILGPGSCYSKDNIGLRTDKAHGTVIALHLGTLRRPIDLSIISKKIGLEGVASDVASIKIELACRRSTREVVLPPMHAQA
jgi:hypothetical protein